VRADHGHDGECVVCLSIAILGVRRGLPGDEELRRL
jgi:hypothetical protein